MFETPQIIIPKKSHILHLAIRNQFVFIYSARIEHWVRPNLALCVSIKMRKGVAQVFGTCF